MTDFLAPNSADYAGLLGAFRDKGYSTDFLSAGPPETDGRLYLRHDIDFDCDFALSAARTEHEMGLHATYFFMLTSEGYNLLAPENAASVREIRDMGHKVGVHFNPLAYDDFTAGLGQEKRLFEDVFDVPVDIVSIHRPTEFFLNHDAPIDGVAHTYQSEYTKRIEYCSDSQGRFRFDLPTQTAAYAAGKSLHLLIHPVWWVLAGNSPQEKMDGYMRARALRLADFTAANCKSFSAEGGKRAMGLIP